MKGFGRLHIKTAWFLKSFRKTRNIYQYLGIIENKDTMRRQNRGLIFRKNGNCLNGAFQQFPNFISVDEPHQVGDDTAVLENKYARQ